MKRTVLEQQVASINQKSAQLTSSGVSHFIRRAEKLLTEEKYSAAMDELLLAQQVDPENQYIRAIMERVNNLQRMRQSREAGRPVGLPTDEDKVSAADVQQAVKQLTEAATRLHQSGFHENAFETLMRAYILDPLNPLVMSTEKAVLPSWELLRKKRAEVEPVSLTAPAPVEKKDPSQRLQQLIEKKEQERHDRDRALWREASNLPKIFEKNTGVEPPKSDTDFDAARDDEEGFFSKFRKRKSLL